MKDAPACLGGRRKIVRLQLTVNKIENEAITYINIRIGLLVHRHFTVAATMWRLAEQHLLESPCTFLSGEDHLQLLR